MSKIVVVMYVSMDGVVEDPAWTGPFWNDEHAKAQHGQLVESRALLLGRVTYEEMAASWPTRDESDPFTARMNSIPKYVASASLDSVGWNAALIRGDIAEQVAALRHEPGQDLLVYGSATLVDHLIANDLVDELRLFVHPVVIGSGRRLFTAQTAGKTWTLAGNAAMSSGAIVLHYRPAAAA